jgi:chromosome segregation ATPase
MDGQVEQEINDMFTKLTTAFDYIKQTFVNANQFAEQVKALQTQVTQLTQDFEQLKTHNAALDEALSTAYRERDEWKLKAEEVNVTNASLSLARENAEKNATEWYEAHTKLSADVTNVRNELSAREGELHEALDENAKLKAELERVTAQINQIYLGLQPRPVVEEVASHEGNQPRDPLTQQWQSWQEKQSA